MAAGRSNVAGDLVEILLLATLVLVIYLAWIVISDSGLPGALTLLGSVGGGALLLFKPPFVRSLAWPLLAFALGTLPHVLFLIVYNSEADDVLGRADYLPHLLKIADAYEHLVVTVYVKTDRWLKGWYLVLYVTISCAAIVVLALWRPRAGRWATRARVAIGLAQVVLLGAVSTTVFAQMPTGRWSPDYTDRLQARWAELDKERTEELLLKAITAAVVEQHVQLHQRYAPALAAAQTSLRPAVRQDVAGATAIVPEQAAGAVLQAVDQELRAKAHDFAQRYAESMLSADAQPTALAAATLRPGSPPVLGDVVDRTTVLALDPEIAAENLKRRAASEGAIEALADAVSDVHVGSPIVDTFASAVVSGVLSKLLDAIAARADVTYGRHVAERLHDREDAPDQPLKAAATELLLTPASPEARQRYDPASVVTMLGTARAEAIRDIVARAVRVQDPRQRPPAPPRRPVPRPAGTDEMHGLER